MTQFFSFPFVINHQIYSYLSDKDKRALACTCRFINHFITVTQDTERLAETVASFILENYDIIYSSLPTKNLKQFLFYKVRFVGFGETHSRDQDRWLNAHLVTVCWNRNSSLSLEGGKQSVEIDKIYGGGQSKYLPKHIVDQADSWDIDVTGLPFLFRYKEFAKITFRMAQAMLDLSFSENSFSLDLYLKFLKRYFDKKQYEKLFQSFPFLKNASELTPQKFSEGFLIYLHFYTLTILLDKQLRQHSSLRAESAAVTESRNTSLLNTIYESLFIQQSSGNLISGRAHLDNQTVIEATKVLHKQYKKLHPGICDAAPILFLQPHNKLTVEAIMRSYTKHFSFSSGAPQDTHSHEDINAIKEAIRKANPLYFDYDQNHYGMWVRYSLTYLEHERALLQKKIAAMEQNRVVSGYV